MATEVVMPQMGESITEGTLTKWLKQPGDTVARDEPLFEISTDKVDAEIPPPAAGVLKEIKVKEGDTVAINTIVAILDADKEGYLRSTTSLIQTAGRAARHLNGEVILYADVMTQSIQKFLAVSEYRRKKQISYNEEHNITPRSVSRAVEESLATYQTNRDAANTVLREGMADIDISQTIKELEEEMLTAANNLEFEKAALLRDQVRELKRALDGGAPAPNAKSGLVSYGKEKLASRGRGRAKSRAR